LLHSSTFREGGLNPLAEVILAAGPFEGGDDRVDERPSFFCLAAGGLGLVQCGL
jgi:hypothetical protein